MNVFFYRYVYQYNFQEVKFCYGMLQQIVLKIKMLLFDSVMVNMCGVENLMWSCFFVFGLLDKGQKFINGLGFVYFGIFFNYLLQLFIVVFKQLLI